MQERSVSENFVIYNIISTRVASSCVYRSKGHKVRLFYFHLRSRYVYNLSIGSLLINQFIYSTKAVGSNLSEHQSIYLSIYYSAIRCSRPANRPLLLLQSIYLSIYISMSNYCLSNNYCI